MPHVRIVAKNFTDMVASLPALKLDKLYESTFVCEAILRSLPPLSKKYVMQMLYINAPITVKLMEQWVLADGLSKHRSAMDRLLQLRIFIESVDRKKGSSYQLNETFKRNLQKYLVYGEALPSQPMPSNVTPRLPKLEDLEAYALEQLTKGERSSTLSSSMMKVVQRGLLSSRENEVLQLTENGFQFLLMDTNAQLWYIIREYISTSEDRGADSIDLIQFLLELSFHVTGEAYNMNTLTDAQQNAIKDLSTLGLVKFQQGRKECWFVPTNFVTSLAMSLSDSTTRKEVNLKHKEDQYDFIWEIIDKRWDRQMHKPLHAAALYLNPGLYYEYEGIESNAEIKGGLFQVISTLTSSSEQQEKVSSQLMQYRSSCGGFGLEVAVNARKVYAPAEWWMSFGYSCPELQQFAIKILSLTCSASPCERNWSTFEMGFMVVETNFKLYANSSSKLHCEILDLFSRIEYQVPNLIVGAITKESLYLAFAKGITAEQIISFLQQNAHPRVATRLPAVPENVTDQIRLWEADRNRVEMIPSHLYDDFPSKELFENACDFARETGGMLWEDSKNMLLILSGEYHEQMRNYLRSQR